MIGFMLRRTVATRSALHSVLFGARPECDQPELKLIDVQMVRIRAALKAVGIELQTAWGSGGWFIDSDDQAALRRLMTEGANKPAVAKAKMRLITDKVKRRTAEHEALRARRMAFVEGC